MAITPFRMLSTMWRKKRSSGAARVVVPRERTALVRRPRLSAGLVESDMSLRIGYVDLPLAKPMPRPLARPGTE
jgi:hypothetical protein